jgi:diadenylate cyclase
LEKNEFARTSACDGHRLVSIHRSWQSAVDLAVLAIAIYWLLRWSKEARALRRSLGILGLWMASLVARQLNLIITAWLLQVATLLAVIVLFIVFQTEVRYALSRLDLIAQILPRRGALAPSTLRAITQAAFSLAEARRGALIVIVRQDDVAEFVSEGVALGGEVSREILEAIFRKVSPVHDGATIIEGDHIARVSTILPLTERNDLPGFYGTRHRAAVGLSERCDALVVVVSEERGEVRLVHNGEIGVVTTSEDLVRTLQQMHVPPVPGPKPSVRRALLGNMPLKVSALALAAFVWSMSYVVGGTSVRTVRVPVEFNHVPADLEIARQSANTLDVRMKGDARFFDSNKLTNLMARFDLGSAHEGSQILTVQPSTLDLPPGLVMESVSPPQVSLFLVRRSPPRSP